MNCFQPSDFGLGNFIMVTPTIKKMSEILNNKPIEVLFQTPFVKECFINCPFIKPVDTLSSPPKISSSMINSTIPDYQYVFETVIGEKWIPKYHTYIDSPKEYDFSSKGDYIVIANGCATFKNGKPGAWSGKKETPKHIHEFIKQNTDLPIYFIGSQRDLDVNTPWMSNIADVIELNNIRKALALIRDSKKAIMNDTGLAHAAGALNKDILILWKDTPFIKNTNPGKYTKYAQKEEWKEKIIHFLQK